MMHHRSPNSEKSPASFEFFSQIGNIEWPQILNPWAGGILSVLYQLDQSQWWPQQTLRDHQWRQALHVLRHTYETSPFYKSIYDQAGLTPVDINNWDDWSKLPIVNRAALQQAGTTWHSGNPPKDHGALLQYFTSGSTGRPMRSVGTTLNLLIKSALVLRQHQWAGRDVGQNIVFIQELGDGNSAACRRANNWEKATEHVVKTGPALVIGVHLPVAEQLELVRKFEPAYVVSYPSVITALTKYCLKHGISLPFLRQVGCYGEILEPMCRDLVKEAWHVEVIDNYSAKEMGLIALQCPEGQHYHVQSEAVIAEVLDPAGRACGPGETGRLVLTSLHNFAGPLIRYEIGDYAELGGHCDCGRSLPVIKRILGRKRNMLKYPDGSERWPSFSENELLSTRTSGLPPVQQFQLIQHTLDRIEARVVLERPYTSDEEAWITGYLRDQLGSHWKLEFSYPSNIERGPSGKFEDFISLCE